MLGHVDSGLALPRSVFLRLSLLMTTFGPPRKRRMIIGENLIALVAFFMLENLRGFSLARLQLRQFWHGLLVLASLLVITRPSPLYYEIR